MASARFGRTALALGAILSGVVLQSPLASAAPTGNAIHGVREVQIAGINAVPADAKAVLLNVTAVNPGADGFLTVFPCGETLPNVSNLNFVRDQTVPNAVIVRPGVGGRACLQGSGITDAIVDVAGYFPVESTATFLASPVRIFDSRNGARATAGTVTAVRVPGSDVAGGAILNVTATRPAAAGFLTVFPCDQPVPNASSVNFAIGQTVPNLVFARPSAAGAVCVYSSVATDLIIDLTGTTGTSYAPLAAPLRVLDGRDDLLATPAWEPQSGVLKLPMQPPVGATAAVVNVTFVHAAAAGYATVYPCGAGVPNASNLNFAKNQTVANLSVVRMGEATVGGSTVPAICFYASTPSDLIVDLSGWMGDGYVALPQPVRADDSRNCEIVVYLENIATTDPNTKYRTKYWARSTRSGLDVLLVDEIVSATKPSLGYGRPYVGKDCYMYVVEMSLVVPTPGSLRVASQRILQIDPQNAVRRVLLELDPSDAVRLIGQHGPTSTLYFTGPFGGQTRMLMGVSAITGAVSVGLTPVADPGTIVMAHEADVLYKTSVLYDGTMGIQRVELARDGQQMTIAAGLTPGYPILSPDGSQLLIVQKTTSQVFNVHTRELVTVDSRAIGWAPAGELVLADGQGNMLRLMPNGEVSSFLSRHGEPGDGIFLVTSSS